MEKVLSAHKRCESLTNKSALFCGVFPEGDFMSDTNGPYTFMQRDGQESFMHLARCGGAAVRRCGGAGGVQSTIIL